MFKITPEIALDSYQKSGLKPMQSDLFPELGCACALGAYAYVNGHKSGQDAMNFLKTLTSIEYLNAFGYGFDGNDFPNYLSKYRDTMLGYDDGKAAWEAVCHLR